MLPNVPDPNEEDAASFRIDDLGEEPRPAPPPTEMEAVHRYNRLPRSSREVRKFIFFGLAILTTLAVIIGTAFFELPPVVAGLALIIVLVIVMSIAGVRAVKNAIKILQAMTQAIRNSEKQDSGSDDHPEDDDDDE